MARARLKDKQVNVRVTIAMLQQIDKAAEQCNSSNSEYVRMLIIQDLQKRKII